MKTAIAAFWEKTKVISERQEKGYNPESSSHRGLKYIHPDTLANNLIAS
jgi:hypothetical protein